MDLDTARIRQLLDKRDAIDEEIRAAIGGEKKAVTCSGCGASGHTLRSCPQRTTKETT